MAAPDVSDFSAKQSQEVSKVLKRNINWKSYFEAKLITKEDLGLLQDYDKHSVEDQSDLLEDKGGLYAALFVKTLMVLNVPETVEYILTLVDQFLQADPRKSSLFQNISSERNNAYVPFMKILRSPVEQPYTNARTISILSVLLRNRADTAAVTEFLRYLIGRYTPGEGKPAVKGGRNEEKRQPANNLEVVLTATKDMLKNSENHQTFLKENGLLPLSQCLRKEEDNMQVLYLGCFSLWLLSFNKSGIVDAFKDAEIVRRLVEVLKKSIHRDKVIRITLATLKNILNEPACCEEMIAHGLIKIMQPIFYKNWKDDDILKDAKVVNDVLEEKVAELSSWEKYRAEVISGNLQWSPVHNEQFFRENIARFEDKNFEVVKTLVELLDSKEVLSLEVACHDLGEFARFFNDGKRVIQKFNGKHKLMIHMNNPNAKVAKQALLSVQKMMVNNWEYLSKSTALGASSTTVSSSSD